MTSKSNDGISIKEAVKVIKAGIDYFNLIRCSEKNK